MWCHLSLMYPLAPTSTHSGATFQPLSSAAFTIFLHLSCFSKYQVALFSGRELTPIFSSVLSRNSKLLVIAQLYPRSTEHLMSNIHLHNTIQHAFAALMQVQTSHLCMMILSRKSCTHHHHQRRRQWIIFAVPMETKLGSTTFRFGSEHQRKMSSIDPATEQSRLCESRRSVILLIEDSRVIGVFCWRLIFAFCGRALC